MASRLSQACPGVRKSRSSYKLLFSNNKESASRVSRVSRVVFRAYARVNTFAPCARVRIYACARIFTWDTRDTRDCSKNILNIS